MYDSFKQCEKQWDEVAQDYQRVFAIGLNDYNASLLRFWMEMGMFRPGCRVLDIGCGVGKYGTYFAELGCDVTLTDISGEMLRYAAENMASYKTPWRVWQCDFCAATGQEEAFRGGFDFSISTMSPAVRDADAVRKMASMTKGWCFLACFQDWRQPFRDKLMAALGMRPRPAVWNLKDDCAEMVQAVSMAGFVPLVKFVDYDWADERTPEELADYMGRNYFSDEPDRVRLMYEVRRLCREWGGEKRTVTDDVNTKVAWIYWNTEEKRA